MPLVDVVLNGRPYTVECDVGEEKHVRELGQIFDKRVRELCGAVGQVGDMRLLLMGGLVVCDELSEALARIDEQDKEIAALRSAIPATPQKLKDREDKMAEMLESATQKIEAIAARLATA